VCTKGDLQKWEEFKIGGHARNRMRFIICNTTPSLIVFSRFQFLHLTSLIVSGEVVHVEVLNMEFLNNSTSSTQSSQLISIALILRRLGDMLIGFEM